MYGLVNEKPQAKFDYDAIEKKGRRKVHVASPKKHADIVLDRYKRKQAENTLQHAIENQPIFAWAIRRHMDAVTRFYFDADYDLPEKARKRVLSLFDWHAKPKNFDAARRHSRDQMMRLFEISRLIDGDALMPMINSKSSARRGSLQLVEGTRIYKPDDLPQSMVSRVSDHGLMLDKWGGTNAFVVCKYDKRGHRLVYDKVVRAENAIYRGYFERYSQTRGVSPVMSAANSFTDISNSMEWQLLKIGIHALFGFGITREIMDETAGLGSTRPEDEEEEVLEEGEYIYHPPELDDGPDFSEGPVQLDLDPGEKFEALESKTPPEGVKDFTELCIRVAILSLDIPYTMFDGRRSTFSHVIADRKMYEQSIMSKQEDNRTALEEYKEWKIHEWVEDGRLTGASADEFIEKVHVRPYPTPWLDKKDEIAAAEKEIGLGLKSIPGIARERRVDVMEVLREQSEYLKEAKSKGVPIYIAHPGAVSEKEKDEQAEIRESEEADDAQ